MRRVAALVQPQDDLPHVGVLVRLFGNAGIAVDDIGPLLSRPLPPTLADKQPVAPGDPRIISQDRKREFLREYVTRLEKRLFKVQPVFCFALFRFVLSLGIILFCRASGKTHVSADRDPTAGRNIALSAHTLLGAAA